MLSHVHAAANCGALADVIVATDSEEVLDLCASRGWHAMMTAADHHSGTDRVYEVASRVAADVYVNIQGDEPLARSEHIEALLQLMRSSEVEVGTLMTVCAAQDVQNPHAVKVVVDDRGRALYFSRAAIPFDRDGKSQAAYFKHLGFYAYRLAALKHSRSLPVGRLEQTERLEQLRFLEHGIAIHVAKVPYDTIGVDTTADLERVEAILQARRSEAAGSQRKRLKESTR